MAYIIFTANGDEMDRRELSVAVTIGRAQDADIPVRDILLSRKHCKLEPAGEGQWIVTDLGSKNGTYLGYRQIARHTLKDGEELRIGRTRVTFRAGPFEPAPVGTKRREVVRPADPTEALAGTVAGFLLVEPGEVEREAGAPVPQPRPPEPTAFASEDVYGMLNEIASSSWDSIKEQASRPLVMERPLPRPSGYRATPPARRTRVAFSLQAPVGDEPAGAATDDAGALGASSSTHLAAPARRRWHIPVKMRRRIAVTVVSAVATAVLVGAWVVAVNRGPLASPAGTIARPRPPQTAMSPDLADFTFPEPSAPLPSPAPSPVRAPPAGAALPGALEPPDLLAAARLTAVWFLIAP